MASIIHFTKHEERSFLPQNTNFMMFGLSIHKNEEFELLFIKIAQETKKWWIYIKFLEFDFKN